MREEIGSRSRLFGTDFIAERAVVADSRAADEDRRRHARFRDRLDEAPRRAHAALEDPILLRRGPAPPGDRFAREIDDRAGAVDGHRPRTGGSVRRPLYMGLCPMPRLGRSRGPPCPAPLPRGSAVRGSRVLRSRVRSRQHDDVVAVGRERSREWTAKESRSAGDHNAHAPLRRVSTPRACELFRKRSETKRFETIETTIPPPTY